MLDPESAVQQWIVLLSGTQLEPDAPQTVERLQGWGRNVSVVIPNEAAAERGPVCQQSRKEDRCESDNIAKNGDLRHCLRDGSVWIPTRAHVTRRNFRTNL
jgi:hypothetical protein